MTKGAEALNPLALLRAQLDDVRYDPVRAVVSPFLKTNISLNDCLSDLDVSLQDLDDVMFYY
jgi:hypothetical protein